MALDDATELPPLRPELMLSPAPPQRDGLPCWQIYDPLRGRYYQLSEEDRRLFGLWRCGSVRALRQVLQVQGHALDEARLERLLRFVVDHQLARPVDDAALQALQRQALRGEAGGPAAWLRHLLGTRVVLWRPQAFLQRTLPLARAAASAPALLVWALLTGCGLWLVARQWDAFVGTFSGLLDAEGALAYGAALLALKLLHELGHGWAAVRHGLPVPHLGLSFSLGMPMIYTDTSASAGLHDRRARLQIGAAGVLAESWVAGLATLAWGLLPDGAARTTAMVLASSSWTTSLLLNLNPLGRFDGYWLLSDALRLDNLQPRAMAWAGWACTRPLIGPVEPPPERVSRRRGLFYLGYGSAVWVWQLLLYGGLAWLFWQLTHSLLVVPVVLTVLWWLIGRPLWRRLVVLWELRAHIAWPRHAAGLGLLVLLVVLLVRPLDTRVAVPAVLGWQQESLLQAPENAQVVALYARAGQPVRAGQLLLRLEAPELHWRHRQAQISAGLAQLRLDRVPADLQDLRDSRVIAAQRDERRAEVEGLATRLARLEVRAPADGLLVDLPPGLDAGQWVRPDQTLGRVLHGRTLDVRGLVSERDRQRLRTGARARFLADDPGIAPLELHLVALDAHAAEQVDPPLLSSLQGGRIAARADAQGRAIAQSAQFAARFALVDGSAALPSRQLRGLVQVEAAPLSLAGQALRQIGRVLLTELRT